MSAKEIYIRLREAGLTVEGACGLLGNMQGESAMRANNAQDGMTGLTDEEYTRRVDAGELDFAGDSVGYGLCQWTYWSRKQALLDFARARGASVGDEGIQVEFCIHELRRDYPALFAALCESGNVYDCAARVCHEYERPAQEDITTRAVYAQTFAEQSQAGNWDAPSGEDNQPAADGNTDDLKDRLTNETVMHLQAILVSYGYNISTQTNSTGVDGYIGKKTVAALKDFTARLEAIA